MDATARVALIEALSGEVTDHAGWLTELDCAIGDGDHGDNMRRGFAALSAAAVELADMALNESLKRAGMILLSSIGGASGPLYASLLLAAGQALDDQPQPEAHALGLALAEGVAAVKRRGHAEVGDKTMIDVLAPVSECFSESIAQHIETAEIVDRLNCVAEESLQATDGMQAKRGRAAYLGRRSIGHLDPGAASSYLLIKCMSRHFGSDQ